MWIAILMMYMQITDSVDLSILVRLAPSPSDDVFSFLLTCPQ
jgi:hypothetical protein